MLFDADYLHIHCLQLGGDADAYSAEADYDGSLAGDFIQTTDSCFPAMSLLVVIGMEQLAGEAEDDAETMLTHRDTVNAL